MATVTAGGRFSPDADQYDSWELWRHPWRWLAWAVTLAPAWRRERGEHGDPAQHRGITHWWGVPAALAVALLMASSTVAGPWWLAWAALAGWTSHLVGDWLCGRQVWGQHGHGIPMAPWWRHRGLPKRIGLKSDGPAAHVIAWAGAVPASVWMVGRIIGL